MPTEEENIQYLYLVLTSAGPPQINWAPISTALSLNAGATSKRWSRLRTALETGKPAGKGAYELLWLCVKHSARDKALDWKDIASKCGTTAGAASKRYSRMKQAWEKEAAAGPVPVPTASAPTTPKKTAAKQKSSPATPASKRKRAPAAAADGKYNHESATDDEEEDGASGRKRARRPGGKNGGATAVKRDPDALPTPTPSSPQYEGFRGFASGGEEHEFRGFRGEGGHGGGDGEGEREEWHEASEFPDGEVDERVSGWLEEI